MVNYDKSTIYKLCCKDPEITDIYVGSTTNFTRRKSQHKQRCNNENSDKYYYKVYKTIREYGGFDNWDMVEVEKYCATDRNDLHTRERFWLEELGATLNMCIPTQSSAEYYKKNKDNIIKRSSEYYNKNKDSIYIKSAEYRAKNKEKISKRNSEYRDKNKEKISKYKAEYHVKNKEKSNRKSAEYRAKNKDKISEQAKEKVQCECGSEVRKDNLTRHRKTKKHQKFIEENSES